MTLVIFNKMCIASRPLNQYENKQYSWWPDVLSIGKTQNVSEIIVYNLSQQKRFFVDVTLKSSMAYYKLMTFGYFATFSPSKRHPNSYLVAQISVIVIFLGSSVIYVKILVTSHRWFERC